MHSKVEIFDADRQQKEAFCYKWEITFTGVVARKFTEHVAQFRFPIFSKYSGTFAPILFVFYCNGFIMKYTEANYIILQRTRGIFASGRVRRETRDLHVNFGFFGAYCPIF